MKKHRYYSIIFLFFVLFAVAQISWSLSIAPLPEDVEVVWDFDQAFRQSNSLREEICMNGLWLWQPATGEADDTPSSNWGYIKVPAPWPGKAGNYMWRETQRSFPHPKWENENLGSINSAWYQREITIPPHWADRRIAISAAYLNSYALVYVDGVKIGEMHFPGGEVDITEACSPGKKHVVSFFVLALPIKAVIQSFHDSNAAKQVPGEVLHRGLCGDVFLVSTPKECRIRDVKIGTSVRNKEICLDVLLSDIPENEEFQIHAAIKNDVRIIEEFQSERFSSECVKKNRISFSHSWMPEKLWDIHTPRNMYEIQVSLIGRDGKVLDEVFPIRFGFREFWIDGRDFILNGSHIFCFAVPFDNAQVSAAAASYEGARESMLRLKSFGVNAVYTHNYGCEPGVHLGFNEILNAADDVGMLLFFSQPHCSQYDWEIPDAESTNGYARHAEFYVRQAQNHPSVVMYSMSHNAAGYSEDMNPDMMDGIQEKRDDWANRNAKRALRAEAIVKQFDPTRIVYHHAGGNLGPLHSSNFYLNFVPIQERSDWFEHWAAEGVKPLFLFEYGAPWGMNWTLYRGWHQGKRDFGSAKVPWQFCMAEWNAQFLGDRAYQLEERDKENLRFEDRQARAGNLWHRWDYPSPVIGSYAEGNDNQARVWAMYIKDNWRAFRTWGLSGFNAWSYGKFWELSRDADKRRKNLDVDWKRLQTPGFSPDFIDRQYERIDTAYERADWIPTEAGEALIKNNQPLLAYIAGKHPQFTSKDHNYLPGQTVEKQIVVINNSRKTVRADCVWSLQLPDPIHGSTTIDAKTGEIIEIPLSFDLPPSVRPGSYEINLLVEFDPGAIQEDTFVIQILPHNKMSLSQANIALFDPTGETKTLLESLDIPFQTVKSDSRLDDFNMLIFGKKALTLDDPAPDISRVRDGMKVIVFEQTAEVLEKRLGFRVQEYGLRRVFSRIKNHPVLSHLDDDHLHDWNGEATILSSRLNYETRPMHGPIIQWCGIDVTRPWRCGCRGNAASVLIEKPLIGDFAPILDGGFNLQYSPLMEYREGQGVIMFCQLDVTGRTENDPAAGLLVSNMIHYISEYKPHESKKAFYAGESAGLEHLEKAGFPISPLKEQELSHDHILIVGPEGGAALAGRAGEINRWLNEGGRMLAIGLEAADAAILSIASMKTTEYINSCFDPFPWNSPFAGIGPSDVMIRSPRQLPLIVNGAAIVRSGILGEANNGSIIHTQLAPWHFNYDEIFHRKMTFRRTSFMLTRLLGNMGICASTPLIQRFSHPVERNQNNHITQARWLKGLYLDQPEEMDDPYRFFRW
ncbi:MAG: hypothetical protein JXR73_05565 [Candidatus Omnitrophica bacterium]|nr:hypothetical protein [Candidatus Omnitrophota bacterium]